jgi:Pyruvate/2-oxoacid:ferredoxin oxidoreductase gamma subunit
MSFDFVIAGVGGQPIDRMTELVAGACAAEGVPFLSTAPRGIVQLGGARLAQISVGECWSAIVTEDTAGILLALEVGEALRCAKYCARDGVALVDRLVIVPQSPKDPRPYPGVEAVEPALKEVIANVHVADFRALARKAGASPDHAYAVLLGAASRLVGLSPIASGWKEGLSAAKADESEEKAFRAGVEWAREAGLPG